MSAPSFSAGQRGLTIVELLVALVLSLLLLTGVVQVFLASKQTYATNEAMSVLQENGRFALEFLGRSVRLGGYYDPTSTPDWIPHALEGPGCGGECSTNGAGNASDQLAVVYQPPHDPGVGKRYDCGGREVTEVVVNVFRVEGGSLRCFSYVKGQLPNQSVALVSGIDRLQGLYGVSTQGDLDSANQYVSADRVADWGMVRAVRLAVLANSERAVNPPPPPRDYILLDAAPVSFDDRLARQIYTTTIQLRNIQ